MDIKEEGMKIPKIEYEVYYQLYNNNKILKLDLKECKDLKIDLFIPVNINNDKLDKYDLNSNYYNNICKKIDSNKKIDISIKDRRNEFIQNNMTICEEDCNLVDYNYTTKKVKCSCLVKIKIPFITEIKFDKDKFYKSFTNINNILNIDLMKCYKTVIKIDNLKNNYGFFIQIFIFILFFITLFLFCCKYYYNLMNIIKLIIEAKKNFQLPKININNQNTDGNIIKNNNIKIKSKKININNHIFPIKFRVLQNKNNKIKKNINPLSLSSTNKLRYKKENDKINKNITNKKKNEL